VYARTLPHLSSGGAERLDDRGCERQRDVADPEPNDLGVGIRGIELTYPTRDFGEQVAGAELAVVLVDPGHRGST